MVSRLPQISLQGLNCRSQAPSLMFLHALLSGEFFLRTKPNGPCPCLVSGHGPSLKGPHPAQPPREDVKSTLESNQMVSFPRPVRKATSENSALPTPRRPHTTHKVPPGEKQRMGPAGQPAESMRPQLQGRARAVCGGGRRRSRLYPQGAG